MSNIALNFYTAFKNKDYIQMKACLHPQLHFRDPIFELDYQNTCLMWQMLLTTAQDFSLKFNIVSTSQNKIEIKWTAHYRFTKTNRLVTNQVKTTMILQDGLIIDQLDQFSLWKWSIQAFGLIGYLAGWNNLFHNKIRTMALINLNKYIHHTKINER